MNIILKLKRTKLLLLKKNVIARAITSISLISFFSVGVASLANALNASRIGRYPVHRQILLPNEFSICCIVNFLFFVRLKITI